MAMASSSATLSLEGGSHFKTHSQQSNKLETLARHQTQLAIGQKKRGNHCRNFSIRAEYRHGGAAFGTLAYIFAPQIRRSILNEDDYGFPKVKRSTYHDDGLEKTRRTLNDKISQLNSAINNVSSRLRGLRAWSNMVTEPTETNSVEAAI